MKTATEAEKELAGQGRVIVETHAELTPALIESIRKATAFQREIRSFDMSLKEAKEEIATAAAQYLDDEGEVTFLLDEAVFCRIGLAYSYRIPKENLPALREALGDRFEELVETEYRPSQRLVTLACDADRGREIRRYLEIRQMPPTVTIMEG